MKSDQNYLPICMCIRCNLDFNIFFIAVFEREREEATEEIGGAAEEGRAGGEGGAEGDPEGQGRGAARRLHCHCQVRGHL